MNTYPVSQERAAEPAEKKHVRYEYEGYQIRVYFSGGKTLTQCIRSLAERREGSA